MSLDPFDTIFTQFPANTAKQWKEKIISDLKGGDFEKTFSSNADQIPVPPFFTQDDLEKYQLFIPLKKNKGWLITERIRVSDVKKANNDALQSLQNGAMSVVFDLQNKKLSTAAIDELLKNILLDIAPVYFENYLPDDKILLNSIAPGSCPAVILVPQLESKSDELTYAVAKGMEQADSLLHFHFFISNNFFFEIAKLRAFRWLWQQVNDIQQTHKEAVILCETGFQNRSDEDENNNILRNTTEAMSAVIGGCDALLIDPHNHDENSSFGKRIARNVQNILLYESGFANLEDAGKGAYFVEYLTYFLSNKVWQKLQSS